jgi:hypothetical protein
MPPAVRGPGPGRCGRVEGRLDDGGAPANGRYELPLSPFNDAKSAAALTAPLVFEDVPVVDGRFRIDVELPLATPSAAWIEVGMREDHRRLREQYRQQRDQPVSELPRHHRRAAAVAARAEPVGGAP